jgi:hypothetical protein
MKYLFYIIIILSVVGFLYFDVFNREHSPSTNDQQTEQPMSAIRNDRDTKMDNQPPVTVRVTPVEFGEGNDSWKFDIAFDAHSGSLDDDLLVAASLVDERGNAYRPIAWEGPGPGGHHRKGVLVFEAINPMPLSVELKIKNVGGVPERSFKWNL